MASILTQSEQLPAHILNSYFLIVIFLCVFFFVLVDHIKSVKPETKISSSELTYIQRHSNYAHLKNVWHMRRGNVLNVMNIWSWSWYVKHMRHNGRGTERQRDWDRLEQQISKAERHSKTQNLIDKYYFRMVLCCEWNRDSWDRRQIDVRKLRTLSSHGLRLFSIFFTFSCNIFRIMTVGNIILGRERERERMSKGNNTASPSMWLVYFWLVHTVVMYSFSLKMPKIYCTGRSSHIGWE